MTNAANIKEEADDGNRITRLSGRIQDKLKGAIRIENAEHQTC